MATPTIPLGIRPPQFESGADTLQRGLGMANLATANQINQVQLQEKKQKAQELAEDREDQNAIQREFLNPDHLKPDKDDPTHRVMDFDSLRGALAGKVRMRSLQQLDKDHLAQVQAIRQTSAAEKADQYNALALKREQNLAVGREIQGLEQLDDKDKPAFYAGALQRLKKQNIDVSDMPETIPGDGSFNQRLQALAAVHGYSGALLNDAMRKQKLDTAAAQEKRAISESESKDSEVQQKKKAAQREEIARMYLAADPQTPEEHLALVDKIEANYPAVAAEYSGIKFDPKTTAKTVGAMALSAEQRARNENSAQDKSLSPIEVALEWAKANNPGGTKSQIYGAALDKFAATVKAEKFEPNAPKVNQQQQKEWMAAYDKSRDAEQSTYPKLQRLEDAISTGNTYITEKGQAIPMAQYVKESDERAPAAIESMRQRANAMRDEIKSAISRKFEYAERLGMEGASTSKDDALKAIDAGKFKAKVPAPAAPTTTPKAAVATKTATMDQVKAFAAKHKLSEADAVKAVQDQGYTISR